MTNATSKMSMTFVIVKCGNDAITRVKGTPVSPGSKIRRQTLHCNALSEPPPQVSSLRTRSQNVSTPALVLHVWRIRTTLQNLFDGQVRRLQISAHFVGGKQRDIEADRTLEQFLVMTVFAAQMKRKQKHAARTQYPAGFG